MNAEQFDLLLHRARSLMKQDLRKAYSLLDEALMMAQSSDNRSAMAKVIREKALFHMKLQEYKPALSGLNEAFRFFQELGDRTGQLECLHDISDIYYSLGDISSALQGILEQLKLHASAGDTNGVADAYNDIGNLYVLLREFTKAVDYYKKALRLFEELKDRQSVLRSFYLLGHCFQLEGDRDRALYYLLRASHALGELTDTDTRIRTLVALANVHTSLREYDKAMEYFHQAMAVSTDGANITVTIQLKKDLGKLYMELTQYDQAITLFEATLTQLETLPPLNDAVQLFECLAICHERTGNYREALAYQKRFHTLDKQIMSEDIQLKTKALHLKYDLEELKKQKEIAELSDKLKEQFLANVSHEIRTPMNGILGMTHLLENTNPTHEQEEYIEAIRDSANNLMVIINDILDFSKINAGKVEFAQKEFSLRELIKGVLQILKVKADEKQTRIAVSIDYNIHDLLIGDPIRLSQILMNLLSNAVKFTDQGTIGIEVKQTGSEHGRCRIRLKISDTGIGIPENKLDRIFDSFEQAENNKQRHEGTGLGLAIVKQLVELQGGHITVKSRLGKGSEFIVEMPFQVSATQASLQKETTTLPLHQTDCSHVRILIVEDNRINQLLVKNMLKQFGFIHFQTADNGRAALQLLEEQTFDIILMDIQMPDMDGYEATRAIRNRLPVEIRSIPIIALSADASETEKQRAREAGMDEYVVKPYTPEELFSTLERYVHTIPSNEEAEIVDRLQQKRKSSGVNLEVLEKYTGGDTDLTVQLIRIFLRQIPEALHRLTTLVPMKDWKEVHATAHKIKSSISVFELSELRKIVTNIEEYARDRRRTEEIPVLLQRFTALANQSIDVLESELKRLETVKSN